MHPSKQEKDNPTELFYLFAKKLKASLSIINFVFMLCTSELYFDWTGSKETVKKFYIKWVQHFSFLLLLTYFKGKWFKKNLLRTTKEDYF